MGGIKDAVLCLQQTITMPPKKRQTVTYYDNGAIETTFEANRTSSCIFSPLILCLMLIP